MKQLGETIRYALWSWLVCLLLGGTLIGVSCCRHGDAGPYPELEYMKWVPVTSMLLVFVMGGYRRSAA